MRLNLVLVAGLAALFLTGCPGEVPVDLPDTGTIAPVDGSTPTPTDASTAASDASTAGRDAATTEADAGAEPADASDPGADAAAPGPDATIPGPDAAAPGPDATTPGPDAAAPGPDAAAPGPDAATNQPPVITALSPTTVDEGGTAIVSVTAADPDGDTVTLALASGSPAWAAFVGANSLVLRPGYTDHGSFSITVEASDGKGGTDTEVLSVSVVDQNGPPVFSVIAPVTVSEGGSTTVTLSAADPEGGGVVYGLGAGAPAFVTISGAVVTLAPGFADAGSYAVTVTSTDGQGGVSTSIINVTVSDTNASPVITPPGAIVAEAGQTKLVPITATDPDGDTVTLSLGGTPPAWATLTGSNLTLSPTAAHVGSSSLTIVASDGKGGSDSEIVSVEVKTGNVAPVLTAISPVTLAEGAVTTVTLSASDGNSDPLTYILNAGAPAFATISGNVVTIAPTYSDSGSYPTVTVTVDDGRGGLDSESFAITVTNVNRNPAFDVGVLDPVTVAENATKTITLNGADPDGDTVSYSLGAAPGFASITGAVITLAPGYADAGTYTVNVVIADGNGGSSPGAIDVTVTNVNRPPVLTQPAPKTVAEAATGTVTLSASDPDGEAVTLTLAAGAPAWASLAGTTLTLTPGYDAAGTHDVAIVATDPHDASDSKTLVVTVTDVNQAPVISTITPVTMTEGETTTVTLTAVDPDGDTVTLSLSGNPAWATIAGDVVTLSPGTSASGNHSITVDATDGKAGGASSALLLVTVNNLNQNPVFGTITPVTLDEGATQDVNIPVTDPDSDPVTLALTGTPPAWASVNGLVVTLAPTFAASGSYTLDLQATDGQGGTANSTLGVTVNNVNQPPVLTPPTAVVMNENATTPVTLVATDGDASDTLTYTLEAGSPTFASIAGAVVTLSPDYSAAGVYDIPVKVSDGHGGADYENIHVTVNDVNRAPVFGPTLTPVTMAEAASQTVALSATDPDGDTVTFVMAGGSPAWASISGSDLQLNPGYDDSGVHTLTVNATDGKTGGTTPATIQVTVTNVNRAPTLSAISNVAMAETDTKTVTLSATDPDSGTTLVYSLVGTPPGWVTLAGNVITLHPLVGNAGTITVTARASDGTLFDEKSFQVVVSATNTAPTLATPGQSSGGTPIAKGGVAALPVTLGAMVTDAQSDNAKVEVEVVLATASFTNVATHSSPFSPTSGPTLITVVVPSLAAGNYKWQIRALDAGGLASAWTPFDYTGFAFAFNVVAQALTGDIKILNGATYATTLSVDINLNVAVTGDPALAKMQFSNDGSSYTGPENYAALKNGWNLATGVDGSRTVYAKITDANSNVGTFTDTIILDRASPTGTFSINGGATLTGTRAVSISVASIADATSGVGTYAFSNDNVNWTTVTPSSGTVAWNLATGGTDGQRTVYGRFTDKAGNTPLNVSQNITLDTLAPTASVSINTAAAYTSTANVTLTVNVGDLNGVSEVCYSNDNSSWTGCGAPQAAPAWTLSSGDGEKTAYIRAKDNAGNYGYGNDKIILDTVKPNLAFTIADPDSGSTQYTNNNSVTITLAATDPNPGSGVVEMRFSANGTTWTGWEGYNATKSWEICGGTTGISCANNVSYTVYAEVHDAAGWLSGASSKSILRDTAAPTGSIVAGGSIAPGPTYSTTKAVTLYLSYADTGGSAISRMQFSENGTTWSAAEPVAATKSYTFASDGAKTISVRYLDGAGNSVDRSDAITVDSTPPSITAFFVNFSNPSYGTNVLANTAYWQVTDATTGVATHHLSNDGNTFTAVVPGGTPPNFSAPWNLTAGEGLKTVTLKVFDVAGLSSTSVDTINYDITDPTWTSFTLNSNSPYTSATAVTGNNDATDNLSGLRRICRKFVACAAIGGYTCQAYAAAAPFTLPAGDGVKTVCAYVEDWAGNASTTREDTITLDTVAPTLTSIQLDGGNLWTTSTTVTVTAVSSDAAPSSGLYQIAFSLDGTTWGAWQGWASSWQYAFPSGEATRTLYAKIRDGALNESVAPFASDSIGVDRFRPTGSIVIGAIAAPGPTHTADTTPSIYLTWADSLSGVGQACLRNDNVTPAAADPCWFAVNSPVSNFALSAGDGLKTVRAWFKDNAGYISSALNVYTDDINLDTTPPPVPGGLVVSATHRLLDMGWVVVNDVNPPTGTASGVEGYEFSVATSPGAYSWRSLVTIPYALEVVPNEVTYYVSVRSVDYVGNRSAPATQVSALPLFPWRDQSREPTSVRLFAVAHTSATNAITVGEGGHILQTSDRFATSVRRDGMVDGTLHALAFNSSYWLAVGKAGTLTRSANGSTWGTSTIVNNDPNTPKRDYFGVTEAGYDASNNYLYPVVGANGYIALAKRPSGSGNFTVDPVTSPTLNSLRSVAHCLDSTNCPAVVVAVGDKGTVVRSANRGATWSTVTVTGVTQDLRAIAAVPSSQTFYAVGWGGRIIKSVNAGVDWTIVDSKTTRAFEAISALDAATMYLGARADGVGENNAYIYSFNGTTLTEITAATPPYTYGSAPFGLDAYDSGNVTWVGAHGEIVSGTGAPLVWTARTSTEYRTLYEVAGQTTSAALAVGASGQIMRTVDGGNTWTSPTSGTTYDLNGVAYPSSTRAWLVGNGGTLINFDGTNFTAGASGTTSNLHDVSCFSATRCVAVGADVITESNATAWSVKYAGGGAGTYRAVTTWTDGALTQRAIAVGDGGIVRRLAGTTWTANATAIAGTPALRSVAAKSNSLALAVGLGGVIYKTTDMGVNWTQITVGTSVDIHDIAFASGNTWYAAGVNTVAKSTDDGATWTPLPNWAPGTTLYGIDYVPGSGVNSLWTVGANATILFSPSGGQ